MNIGYDVVSVNRAYEIFVGAFDNIDDFSFAALFDIRYDNGVHYVAFYRAVQLVARDKQIGAAVVGHEKGVIFARAIYFASHCAGCILRESRTF